MYSCLTVTEPVDLNATYPSSYANGGSVGWTKTQTQDSDTIEVSYPAVRCLNFYGVVIHFD